MQLIPHGAGSMIRSNWHEPLVTNYKMFVFVFSSASKADTTATFIYCAILRDHPPPPPLTSTALQVDTASLLADHIHQQLVR